MEYIYYVLALYSMKVIYVNVGQLLSEQCTRATQDTDLQNKQIGSTVPTLLTYIMN